MQIKSDTLTFNAIDDSKANSVTIVKGMDSGKKQMVSTRLVGAFFTDLGEGDTSTVSITGTAVMEFASSSSPAGRVRRKLVRLGSRANVAHEKSINAMASDGGRRLENGSESSWFGSFRA